MYVATPRTDPSQNLEWVSIPAYIYAHFNRNRTSIVLHCNIIAYTAEHITNIILFIYFHVNSMVYLSEYIPQHATYAESNTLYTHLAYTYIQNNFFCL